MAATACYMPMRVKYSQENAFIEKFWASHHCEISRDFKAMAKMFAPGEDIVIEGLIPFIDDTDLQRIHYEGYNERFIEKCKWVFDSAILPYNDDLRVTRAVIPADTKFATVPAESTAQLIILNSIVECDLSCADQYNVVVRHRS